MNYKLKKLLVTSALITSCLSANAAEGKYEHEEIVVRAGSDIKTSGSATVIDKKYLDLYEYQDIDKVLRAVPGVEGYNEDGYGHRPNIGFRGGKSERSQGITLMEDGILIAPAPYSAPSAYYFPKVERAEEIEVLKGAGAVKTGPRTTSGALNIITKKVPNETIAEVKNSYGNHGASKFSTTVGSNYKNVGALAEFNHVEADGFKKLKGEAAGAFDIDDLVTKLRFTSKPGSNKFQSLEFKYAKNAEISRETYLGLADADYEANPYQRYTATEQDKFDGTQEQFQVTHYIEPADNLSLATTFYNNQFERNWYKLDKVVLGGTQKSLSNSLLDSTYLDALKGNTDTTGSANDYLKVKANNREYDTKGVDFKANYQVAGKLDHNIDFGLRYHFDDETRYQKTDNWDIDGNGNWVIQSFGAWGSSDSNNKVTESNAVATYISDEIKTGPWTITPGLRYESIHYKLNQRVSGSVSENSIDELMPALAVNYDLNKNQQIFATVSKGFAPATGVGSNVADNEESINYEIGTRVVNSKINYELIGFFNDYENLLGTCTAGSGCSGNIGDQFDGGEVNAFGVEFSADTNLVRNLTNAFKLPLKITYTHTRAEFRNSFNSSYDIWGDVTAGDQLPYVAENTAYASLGFERNNFNAEVSLKYQDAMNTSAAGTLTTDANTTYDAAANYQLSKNFSVYGNVKNIFDNTYVAARHPYGVRVSAPRLFFIGAKLSY